MDTNYLFIGDICKLESITTTLGNSVNHLNDLSLESYINEEITYNAKKIKTTILYRMGTINKVDLDVITLKKYTGEYYEKEIGEYFINEETLISFNKIISPLEQTQDLPRKKVLTKFREYQETKN